MAAAGLRGLTVWGGRLSGIPSPALLNHRAPIDRKVVKGFASSGPIESRSFGESQRERERESGT